MTGKFRLPDAARHPILIYIVKCVAGVSIGYGLKPVFPQHQLIWAMISTVLVISPESGYSASLAVTRIKANIIGSFFGLLVFFVLPPGLAAICAGIVLTILACSALGMPHTTRTALAALIIVTISEGRTRDWHIAIERMGCVMAGCLIAMGISFLFDRYWERSGTFPAKPRNPAPSLEHGGE